LCVPKTSSGASVFGFLQLNSLSFENNRLAPNIPLSPAKQSGIGIELTIDGLKDFAQMIVLDIRK
jgi:hypothetical protein